MIIQDVCGNVLPCSRCFWKLKANASKISRLVLDLGKVSKVTVKVKDLSYSAVKSSAEASQRI